MPVQRSCTPPIKRTILTVEAQPWIGSSKMSFLIMTKPVALKAHRQHITPMTVAMISGTVEKATMPSIA